MKLYMCITPDKYELPLAVCDSPRELAAVLGISRTTVNSVLSEQRHGRRRGRRRYIDVDITPESCHYCAEVLKSLMKKAGLNSCTMAEAIGTSQNAVSQWTRGIEPNTDNIYKLAEYFGVDVDVFFREEAG